MSYRKSECLKTMPLITERPDIRKRTISLLDRASFRIYTKNEHAYHCHWCIFLLEMCNGTHVYLTESYGLKCFVFWIFFSLKSNLISVHSQLWWIIESSPLITPATIFELSAADSPSATSSSNNCIQSHLVLFITIQPVEHHEMCRNKRLISRSVKEWWK